MVQMWITPKSKANEFDNPLNIEDKIRIFEEQVLGWQIEIAEKLATVPDSGYGVLAIMFSYFEMIAKFYDGYGGYSKSEKYFNNGFLMVFVDVKEIDKKEIKSALKILYQSGRCGQYHSGLAEGKIFLSGSIQHAIEFNPEIEGIFINPEKLISAIKQHFYEYVAKLKNTNNDELRANFERRFNFIKKYNDDIKTPVSFK
ncbi:MAG: hypothetical protein KAS16_03510 [Thermoplasmata archaeon]|nr:hypothetical protein [Thermoplasmata archaeon]